MTFAARHEKGAAAANGEAGKPIFSAPEAFSPMRKLARFTLCLVTLLVLGPGCNYYRVVDSEQNSGTTRGSREWSLDEYEAHRAKNQWVCFDASNGGAQGEFDTSIHAQIDFVTLGIFHPALTDSGARVVEQGGRDSPSQSFSKMLCGPDEGRARAIVGIAPRKLLLYYQTSGKSGYNSNTRRLYSAPSVGARISVNLSDLVGPYEWRRYAITLDPREMLITLVPQLPDGGVDSSSPAYLVDYSYRGGRMQPKVVVRELQVGRVRGG